LTLILLHELFLLSKTLLCQFNDHLILILLHDTSSSCYQRPYYVSLRSVWYLFYYTNYACYQRLLCQFKDRLILILLHELCWLSKTLLCQFKDHLILILLHELCLLWKTLQCQLKDRLILILLHKLYLLLKTLLCQFKDRLILILEHDTSSSLYWRPYCVSLRNVWYLF
jgi:hypothetical protein